MNASDPLSEPGTMTGAETEAQMTATRLGFWELPNPGEAEAFYTGFTLGAKVGEEKGYIRAKENAGKPDPAPYPFYAFFHGAGLALLLSALLTLTFGG
jgi:hypothetical protein